ncbi:LiaF transmembrane domain-containing protein, partial [Liquorilactobacillus sp.]|uniref:LiaF transmembrane domain-containing protein n=1 Tax=Liquorilactobacillus sp. TaxID=2767923 RepID=UPI0039EB5C5E
MRAKRFFLGIIIFILAILLVSTKLEIISFQFKFWTIVLTVLFIFLLVQGMVYRRILQSVFSIALLVILYAKELGIERLGTWTIILVAFLVSAGLSMIFKSFGKNRKWYWNWKHKISSLETDTSEKKIKINESMSSSVRYIKANNLEQVAIDARLASLKVYFDNVQIEGNEANIFINGSLSEIILFFP